MSAATAALGEPRLPVAWHKGLAALGLLAWLAALAGCTDLQLGESGREAELARQRGARSVMLVRADDARAVFKVKSRAVVIEPPEGYCLDPDSAITTRRLGFVLISDCLHSHAEAVFPAILTVSVSGEPIKGAGSGLDGLEALLESERGRRLLGRGPSQQPGAIVATRRIGQALYVLVEESPNGKAQILQPRFWRAFVPINDRLVLVTVSGFADRPVGEDAMLAFAAAEVARLRRANGMPPDPEEDEIAALAPRPGARPAVEPPLPVVSAMTPWATVPLPPARPARSSPAGSGSTSAARRGRPAAVPLPPPRPG